MASTKTLVGYRSVSIRFGDTLQIIAARELGDANRWADLIAINDLTFPFLTGDPDVAGPKVLLYGDRLIVPAASVQATAAIDPAAVFGTDLLLTNGLLGAEDGDFALVSGRANLDQAIFNRLGTALKELMRHPTYGCGVHGLKGKSIGPTAAQLASQFVRGALLSDRRISSVPKSVARVGVESFDAVSVEGTAVAVSGAAVDFKRQI